MRQVLGPRVHADTYGECRLMYQAEAQLHESEERYRRLVECVPDAIVIHDGVQILYANAATVALAGVGSVEELVGQPTHRFIPQEWHAAMAERRALMCTTDAPAPPMDMLLLRSDGRSIPVEIYSLPLRYAGQTVFLIIVRDRTIQVEAAAERCLLERQLKEARKLESFGLLAGGVVHDFNNILSVLLGNAQLAGRLMECEETEAPPESPTGNQLRQSIHAIEQATRSAITLVQQLFATTGKGMQPYHLLHLPSLCHEVQQMLQVSFPATALLVNDVDGDAPLIWGNQAQVLQVMMNLLTNAVEALGGMPGWVQMTTLTAQLDRVALDATLIGSALSPGAYVAVVVSDTGCGMDEQTLSRIFDPFWTTKGTGQGLGLAALLGIMRTHRGTVQVQSTPGQGTCFTVWFPVAQTEAGIISS